MNKTLIIYDLDGRIISQMNDGYIVPNGLPYIEVEVPKGKYVTSVNAEMKEPILEDIPPTEMELLQDKISILEMENADLLLDSAMKDIKISTLENDVADIILEIAGGM